MFDNRSTVSLPLLLRRIEPRSLRRVEIERAFGRAQAGSVLSYDSNLRQNSRKPFQPRPETARMKHEDNRYYGKG